jgi:hypothetical protein
MNALKLKYRLCLNFLRKKLINIAAINKLLKCSLMIFWFVNTPYTFSIIPSCIVSS